MRPGQRDTAVACSYAYPPRGRSAEKEKIFQLRPTNLPPTRPLAPLLSPTVLFLLRNSFEQAFAYNFLSALSAVLGTIIILSLSGSISNATISVILLVGAGTFIFIALVELLPEALDVSHAVGTKGGKAVLCSQSRKLLSFLLGAVLIGVPLIFDQHCEADGHDH